jgi:hypothetical protein
MDASQNNANMIASQNTAQNNMAASYKIMLI